MPDTIVELCEQIDSIDSQSSLMKKAGPILRRNLIDALIRRVPYTYKEVFNHFKLGAEGISFTAFYYWARKVRRTAALTEMARSCSEAENPVELIPKIIAQRLLDASLDEDISVNRLSRLTHIYRMTSYVEFARKRHEHRCEQAAANRCVPRRSARSPDDRPQSERPDDELLSRVNAALAAGQARLDEERAAVQAQFEETKRKLVALGYPVADCLNLDELDAIIARIDEDADSAKAHGKPAVGSSPDSSRSEISNSAGASRGAAVETVLSRTQSSGNPFPRETPTAPTLLASLSEISNPEISNSIAAATSDARSQEIRDSDLIPLDTMRRTLPIPQISNNPHVLPSLRSDDQTLGAIDESPDSHQPGENPRLPLIKQDFPDPDPDPRREALRRKVRTAYDRFDAIPHVKDWISPELCAEYGLSPSPPDNAGPIEQSRRREIRNVLIRFGLMKDSGKVTDQSRARKEAPNDA